MIPRIIHHLLEKFDEKIKNILKVWVNRVEFSSKKWMIIKFYFFL